MIDDTGISFGVGINDKPFSSNDISALFNVIDDRLLMSRD